MNDGARVLSERIGGVPVVVLQGRAHLYEGGDLGALRVPVLAFIPRLSDAGG